MFSSPDLQLGVVSYSRGGQLGEGITAEARECRRTTGRRNTRDKGHWSVRAVNSCDKGQVESNLTSIDFGKAEDLSRHFHTYTLSPPWTRIGKTRDGISKSASKDLPEPTRQRNSICCLTRVGWDGVLTTRPPTKPPIIDKHWRLVKPRQTQPTVSTHYHLRGCLAYASSQLNTRLIGLIQLM